MLSIKTFLLIGAASFVTAEPALAQRAIVTARAILPPRGLLPRDNHFTCASATDTVCADSSGCCPQGAACFQSDGVGLCSVICEASQPTCVFNGVTACCPYGDACGGSLCIPAALSTGAPGPAIAAVVVPSSSSESDTTTTQTSTTHMIATVTAIRSVSRSTSCLPDSCTCTVYVTANKPSPVSAFIASLPLSVQEQNSPTYSSVSISTIGLSVSNTTSNSTLNGTAYTYSNPSNPTTTFPLGVPAASRITYSNSATSNAAAFGGLGLFAVLLAIL